MNSTTSNDQRWRIFALAAVVVFMVSLDATVVVAAFPALRRHFATASPAALSWSLNGYTIVYAALLVAGGRLVDRHGHRRGFLHALALFTTASVGCAIAGNAMGLALARMLQAMGAAVLTPAALALVLAAFPATERQKVVHLWSAVGAMAAAVGPMTGSALIEWFSWPIIFLINLPIGIMAWAMGRRILPESPERQPVDPIDLPGTFFIMAGVGAMAFGLVNAGEAGGHLEPMLISLGCAVISIFAYRWIVRRRDRTPPELGLFHSPAYRRVSQTTFLFGAAFSAGFLTFYLFMTGPWKYSQSLAGLAATPGPVVVIVVATLISGWIARFGRRAIWIVGGLLYSAGNLWFCARLQSQPDFFGTWLPGQLVIGAGIGLLLPTLTGAALSELNPGNFGLGNAVHTAVRLLGGSLGIAVTVALVGRVDTALDRYRILYGGLAGAGLLMALLSIRVGPRSESPRSHH